MSDEMNFTKQRHAMVSDQIITRGIRDPRLLAVLREVPRHRFTPLEYVDLAYTDGPLPIGHGQTISQPYIVALMTELLELTGEENVLEVGTGSGYQAAVLSRLARMVHTVERFSELAELAEKHLHEIGVTNVQVHVGDGSLGYPAFAPYEAIMVTAAAPEVPKPLLEQLAPAGRLVIPVGSRGGQVLERWRREEDDFQREDVLPVAFVPLRGEHGWKGDRWGWF